MIISTLIPIRLINSCNSFLTDPQMFRRCVMSHGRRLMTASSCEHQTGFKTYRSHMIPPLKPYKQLQVFRSLSTATPPNDRKVKDSGSFSSSSSLVETGLGSFYEWMKNIYDEFIRMKKEYEDMKYVWKHESLGAGHLQYHITGFISADDKSMTVGIRNIGQFVLVVSGRTYMSDGRSVVERYITLPNGDYSEAKPRATFNSNTNILVVEIFDYKLAEDIKIKVELKKA